jgi:hypothetical protein
MAAQGSSPATRPPVAMIKAGTTPSPHFDMGRDEPIDLRSGDADSPANAHGMQLTRRDEVPGRGTPKTERLGHFIDLDQSVARHLPFPSMLQRGRSPKDATCSTPCDAIRAQSERNLAQIKAGTMPKVAK